jgi:hypothetical protein
MKPPRNSVFKNPTFDGIFQTFRQDDPSLQRAMKRRKISVLKNPTFDAIFQTFRQIIQVRKSGSGERNSATDFVPPKNELLGLVFKESTRFSRY